MLQIDKLSTDFPALDAAYKLTCQFTKMGYPIGAPLYRVTIDDLICVLAPHLVKAGISVETMTQEDFQAIVDQVSAYLNGEGMPWHEIVSLGITEALSKRTPALVPGE